MPAPGDNSPLVTIHITTRPWQHRRIAVRLGANHLIKRNPILCEGITGHAEVVQLTFDPREISFKEILQVFFTINDPTTLNRQGADIGTQYRSAVLYNSQEQKVIAEEVISELTAARIWDAPIVTELSPAPVYFKAEDYHQNYFRQHPLQGYCAFVVAPKVAKFRKVFVDQVNAGE